MILSTMIRELNALESKIDDIYEAYDYIIDNNNIDDAIEEFKAEFGYCNKEAIKHYIITAAIGN